MMESNLRESIWQQKQNKLSYVADDLEPWVPRGIVLASLMRRGVGKWLACRRDLIALKNSWKAEVTKTIAQIRIAKREGDTQGLERLRGRLEAIVGCRKAVRQICHSERWRLPNHDWRARRDMEGA